MVLFRPTPEPNVGIRPTGRGYRSRRRNPRRRGRAAPGGPVPPLTGSPLMASQTGGRAPQLPLVSGELNSFLGDLGRLTVPGRHVATVDEIAFRVVHHREPSSGQRVTVPNLDEATHRVTRA
jgi:hypothetical protein